jgi:branched-chain amino acid transport system substrate-binding protein
MVPAYLFQVKSPSESSGTWDVYRMLSVTPADRAYLSMAQGGCGMVKS